MEEVISTIINNTISSFDFPFCIAVNVATYITIKLITDYKKKSKVSTWNKRLIFVLISIIIAIIYFTMTYFLSRLINVMERKLNNARS